MARGRKKVEDSTTAKNEEILKEETTVPTEVVENQVAENLAEEPKQEQTTERATYKDENGKEYGRSGYIRHLFLQDLSRSDIAKKLNVKYGVVYAATANMYNAVHKEGERVARGSKTIKDPSTGEVIDRKQYIEKELEAGKTRQQVADELGVAYATVYSASKEVDLPQTAGRARVFLEVDGEKIARSEFIRKEFADGKSRREIANEIGCDYAVVWAATKTAKAEENDAADATPETPRATEPEVTAPDSAE